MRLLVSSLILSSAALIAWRLEAGHDRWSTPIGESVMGETRGSSPDSAIYSDDVCAAQNVQPNSGEQTAGRCSDPAGPDYPFGECIDCGTQLQMQFMSEVSSGKRQNPNPVTCNFIVMKTGDCIRDQNNNYYCADAQPDANNTPCAGQMFLYPDQSSPN